MNTVTTLSDSENPFSTWSGSQGLCSTFSVMASKYFAKWPWQVAPRFPRSPMQLNMMSLTARPTEAFTPQPCELKSRPSLIPISLAMGPLTTTMGKSVCAVVMTWLTWNSSAPMACTAVTMMGMAPGAQPAMMALAAMRSTVISASLGMRRAIISSPLRPEAATNRSTISSVGGMTGSPSVAPRSKSAPFAPMGSPAIERTPLDGVLLGDRIGSPVRGVHPLGGDRIHAVLRDVHQGVAALVGHGVIHQEKAEVGGFIGLGEAARRRLEPVSHHHDGGDAAFFKLCRVVDTPRRAAPSDPEAGYRHVAVGRYLIERLLPGALGGPALLVNQELRVVALGENFADVAQKVARVGHAVVEERDAEPVQACYCGPFGGAVVLRYGCDGIDDFNSTVCVHTRTPSNLRGTRTPRHGV